MKHLIIFAHPDDKTSFNAAILNAVIKASHDKGVDVEIRDLYLMNFNPVLSHQEIVDSKQGIISQEIKNEQCLLEKAQLITLIYPLFLMGYPAILKGYLERILAHDGAYKLQKNTQSGIFAGKKIQEFITVANTEGKYHTLGFDKSLEDCLVNGLFHAWGTEDVRTQIFYNVHGGDDKTHHQMLEKVYFETEKNLDLLK
ncbi:hypothetical protein A6A19_02010 [Actinobacillus delphinicola]|uniref:NAD(P)H-dependent oxidoreductase n=1 Tax=Actinobacillus delphinicola TaxID=51161 RepID=UPI00244315AD|nr:NAD(P)H-dependent oxidoreductase [Actinobacillus delphinicola]MDG6896802.1 hypothetical protein [Actinobacillus delphinicola]